MLVCIVINASSLLACYHFARALLLSFITALSEWSIVQSEKDNNKECVISIHSSHPLRSRRREIEGRVIFILHGSGAKQA